MLTLHIAIYSNRFPELSQADSYVSGAPPPHFRGIRVPLQLPLHAAEQVRDSVRAAGVTLDEDTMARVDEAVGRLAVRDPGKTRSPRGPAGLSSVRLAPGTGGPGC
jgi:hypothetical protein